MPTIPHFPSGSGFSTQRNSSSSAKKTIPSKESVTPTNIEEYNFAKHREMVFGKMKISPIDFAEQQMSDESGHERRTHFLMGIRSYPFTFEEKTEIAKKYPSAVSKYLHRFHFDNSEQKVEFLSCLINALDHARMKVSLQLLCEKMVLKSQAELMSLGDTIVNTPYIFHLNRDLNISEQGKRYEWASQSARLQSERFLSSSDVFKLHHSDLKSLLLTAIDKIDLASFWELKNIPGLNEEDKTELLIALAKRSPAICANSMSSFPEIDEKNRIRIARVVASTDPVIIIRRILSFNIEDESVLQDLFITYFKPFVQSSLHYMQNSKSDDFEKDVLLENMIGFGFSYIDDTFNKSAHYPDFTKNAEKLGIKIPVIANMLDDIGHITVPAVRNSLQEWTIDAHIRLLNTPHTESVKQNLSTSLAGIYRYRQPDKRFVLTKLLIAAIRQNSEAPDSIQQFEEVCRLLTRPHTLAFRPILSVLDQQVSSGKTMIEKYAALLSRDEMKDKTRQHHVMNGFLALFNARKLSHDDRQHILQVLTPANNNKQTVKEFAKNMQSLNDFIPLTEVEKFEDKALNELLKINSGNDLNNAFGKLFLLVLGREAPGKNNDKEAAEFIKKFQEVTKDFRRPDALLTYCSRLYVGLADHQDKQEIFQVMNQFIDNVLLTGSLYKGEFPDNQWVNNISDAYRDEKNNIANSQHLTNANNINPEITRLFLSSEIEIKQVFERYGAVDRDINISAILYRLLMQNAAKSQSQFPAVFQMLKGGFPPDAEFLRSEKTDDDELLLSLLNKDSTPAVKEEAISELIQFSSLEHNYPELVSTLDELRLSLLSNTSPDKSQHDWTLKFTHDVENHLLCGTEVTGSCLAVHENTINNRALMGVVVQGKNRIITLHSADNTIQARCLIRLGIDKASNQLVLQLEKTYDNPAAPLNTKKVFGEFARDFAKKLGGIPILTAFTSYGRFEPYSNTISFDGDRAWVEYVDSDIQDTVSSREGFSIAGIFQLK